MAKGLRKDRDGERWEIKVLDGLTGKKLWSRQCARGGGFTLDPSGDLLAISDPEGMTLWEPRSGNALGRIEPLACLSPGGYYFITTASSGPGSPTGLQVHRKGMHDALVALAIDGGFVSTPTFNFDGSLLAYANPDGSVSVCNLPQIQARLVELGLGW